jgi:4-alpha-glucanotransferase
MGCTVSAVEELAKRCGIADTSTDAFGKEHVTPVETKRALLHAMGLDAGSEEAARSSLDRLVEEEWAAAVPPVLVAYRDRPIEVRLTLPADTEAVTWHVALEAGGELSGEVRFKDLPLEASRSGGSGNRERRLLTLGIEMPDGYHRLRVDQSEHECALIGTPGKCWLPETEDHRKLFGVAAQIYLLRSRTDWGIGDFEDLRKLAAMSRQQGADVVGVNPLHAMFLDQPDQASPYSPSDRLLLNLLYLSIDNIPELAECREAQTLLADGGFRERLQRCREAEFVQYEQVAELKLPILRMLFAHFEREATPARVSAFEAFHKERPELLDRACTFQALREFFTQADPERADCTAWPEPYRSHATPEVQQFRREHADSVRFHLWAQWVADDQLKAAAEACDGMAVGLFRDLAVGSAPSGAEVWSHPDSMVTDATIGAPPDVWNPAGQNWGLPPLHPQAARDSAYATFIELIRTNMRHAGALRIDHALALQRLYWIPQGGSAKDGAYVAYPMDDLLGVLALESQRNRCMVIGEDLGTVPKGFRERVAQANVLSYRLLFFERDESGFLQPDQYPTLSLSMASSHDLPTLRGWWNETDLEAKQRLNLFPTAESAESSRVQRVDDRKDLLTALHEAQLTQSPDALPSDTEFVRAAHALLAQTKSMMTLFQLDDLTGELEQVNIPGTTHENPNWRRRLAKTLEEVASTSRVPWAA